MKKLGYMLLEPILKTIRVQKNFLLFFIFILLYSKLLVNFLYVFYTFPLD